MGEWQKYEYLISKLNKNKDFVSSFLNRKNYLLLSESSFLKIYSISILLVARLRSILAEKNSRKVIVLPLLHPANSKILLTFRTALSRSRFWVD